MSKFSSSPPDSNSIASQIAHSLGGYFKTTVKNALIETLLFVIGFAIAGVPAWPITGVLCGLLNLFPNFGPLFSLGTGLLIVYFSTADWMRLASVAGVWLVIQIIDGFVLAPRAASRSGVPPLLSIVLVLIAGFALGPIGMILAVPAAAVILIILRAFRSRPQ